MFAASDVLFSTSPRLTEEMPSYPEEEEFQGHGLQGAQGHQSNWWGRVAEEVAFNAMSLLFGLW